MDYNFIKIYCEYMNLKDIDSFRCCSKNLKNTLSQYYFSCTVINAKLLNKLNEKRFDNFARKYKPILHIKNVRCIEQLLYLKNYNVESIKTNNFEGCINSNIFASTLKYLTFDNNFNNIFYEVVSEELIICLLPDRLIYLELGHAFNQPIYNSVFPSSLLYLTLGNSFNHILTKNALPLNLLYLKLGNAFNTSITEGVLPTSLQILILGNGFNELLLKNTLPTSLKTLILGDSYNQPIYKDILPTSLKILKFGSLFNIAVDEGVIPDDLQELTFGRNFNNVLTPFVLPKNLRMLALGENFNSALYLPDRLYKLIIRNPKYEINPDLIPIGLKCITRC
jgi:hypothetical protein